MAQLKITPTSWKVQLDDGEHEVRLEHGAFRRKVFVDGKVVYKKYLLFETGAIIPLKIADHEFHVRIFSDLSRYKYAFGPGLPSIYKEEPALNKLSQKAGPWVCLIERWIVILFGVLLSFLGERLYFFCLHSPCILLAFTLGGAGLYLVLKSVRSLLRAAKIGRDYRLTARWVLYRQSTANIRFFFERGFSLPDPDRIWRDFKQENSLIPPIMLMAMGWILFYPRWIYPVGRGVFAGVFGLILVLSTIKTIRLFRLSRASGRTLKDIVIEQAAAQRFAPVTIEKSLKASIIALVIAAGAIVIFWMFKEQSRIFFMFFRSGLFVGVLAGLNLYFILKYGESMPSISRGAAAATTSEPKK